jgi:hypothetical protein
MIESAKGSYSRQLGMFYWRDYAIRAKTSNYSCQEACVQL